MPQSRMPGLYEGRKWTVEVYSPLRPSTDPMEIMQATSGRRDLITWGGKGGKRVAGRLPGRSGKRRDARAARKHAWLWVRDDGVVLQHRIAVLDSTLTFVRMPAEQGHAMDQEFRRACVAFSRQC